MEEFPGLVAVSKRMGMRKFELITVSTDLPEQRAKAQAFLDRNHVALPSRLAESLKAEGRKSNNYLFTDPDVDALVAALDSKWSGAQPHTVLVAPGGKVVFRHTGKLKEADLLDVVLKELSTFYHPKPK